MNDTSRIAKAFSRAAPDYDAAAMQQKHVLETLWSMAAPALAQVDFVLDVGCGTGALAAHTRQRIVGLDAALGMCEQARRKGVMACAADMHTLPLADASAPALISSLSMQWSHALPLVLREYHRVLKTGCFAGFSIYLLKTLNELNKSFNVIHKDSPVRLHPSHEELLDMIKAAGFRVTQSRTQTLSMEHNRLKELLLYLKEIGAHTPAAAQPILRSGAQYRALEAAYRERYGSIISSWEIGYYLIEKTA